MINLSHTCYSEYYSIYSRIATIDADIQQLRDHKSQSRVQDEIDVLMAYKTNAEHVMRNVSTRTMLKAHDLIRQICISRSVGTQYANQFRLTFEYSLFVVNILYLQYVDTLSMAIQFTIAAYASDYLRINETITVRDVVTQMDANTYTTQHRQTSLNRKDLLSPHHIVFSTDLPDVRRFEPDRSIAPTRMDYRQFWQKVEFNSDRRCKCLRCNSNRECNCFCMKQHCANSCCSADGCKWTCAIAVFVLFSLGITGVAHRWMMFELLSFDEPNQSIQSYPICDAEYNSYLNVMDLTYFAITARHHTVHGVRSDIKIWFGDDSDWDLVSLMHNPYFFHLYSAQHKIHIVSIQSEPNPSLLLQQIGQWSEVSMFGIFSSLVPLTNVLPKAFLRTYIKFVSLFEYMIAPDIRTHFDAPVYEYIRDQIVLQLNESRVIVVGHSVGGAAAHIVGATLYDNGYNVMSFGLSSPGCVYSSGKFGFSVESLDKSSVSILSRRDVIANIDDYAGLVQNIECTAQSNEECHGSVTSFCQLYDQCTDNVIRNMSFVECVCNDRQLWDDCM
eukprot:477374_1